MLSKRKRIKSDKEVGILSSINSFIRDNIYFVSVVLVFILFIIGLIVYYQNRYKGEGVGTLPSKVYSNEKLFFSLGFPDSWIAQENDSQTVEDVIRASKSGLYFDIYKDALKTEVVPVSFIKELSEDSKSFKAYASLSLRGTDVLESDMNYLVEPLTDELKELLEFNDNKNIVIDKQYILDSQLYRGILLRLTSTYRDVPIYYTQITRFIGKNIISILLSSTQDNFDEDIKDIDFMLSNFVITSSRGSFSLPVGSGTGKDELSVTPVQIEGSDNIEIEGVEETSKDLLDTSVKGNNNDVIDENSTNIEGDVKNEE